MIEETVEQLGMLDQDTWSGKTSPEHSAPTKEKTSESYSKKQRKSLTKMPLFLDLRRESGQRQDASWQMGGALLGEYSMHSFGETPKEDVESHLSQILEDNPHPKYFLSDRACLGILTRANRRGKKLPPMLEEALIQMVVGGTEYGQEGIADTIEILRKMRCEIGEEALKEWIQRTFVLVQSEEILLAEMCKQGEDSEDTNEQELVEGDCEENVGQDYLLDVRIDREVRDSSQGWKPNEQLIGQLDMLMQKLPHKDAQKAVILHCVRIACESEESLPETLSTVPQGEGIGADDSERVFCFEPGAAKRLGGHVWEGLAPTLRTEVGDNRPSVAYTVKIRGGCEGGGKGALVQTNKSATLSTLQDQILFQPVYSVENHPNDSRVGINEDGKVQALTSRMGTGGGNVPMVMQCYSKSKRAQSATDNETWVESEKANTLNAFDVGDVITTEAVVYALDRASLQSNMAHSLNGNNIVRTRYIVRRLTPLECERLQGYPDGWTDIGEYTNSKGKKCKASDASRYKALGNSIALPSWKWVLKRICGCYERDATMASLFDGLGGFPYLWQQINGKGSCLWASEIEEFPIAVTKERIG